MKDRDDPFLPVLESPVEADSEEDREGVDGLVYVTGVTPHHSQDEMFRQEEQQQAEARDADLREEAEARRRVRAARRGRVHAAAAKEEVPDDSGSSEDDALMIAPDLVVPIEELEQELEAGPRPTRFTQDVDVQGRAGDPDRDWQGQPFADDPDHIRLNDGSRRR